MGKHKDKSYKELSTHSDPYIVLLNRKSILIKERQKVAMQEQSLNRAIAAIDKQMRELEGGDIASRFPVLNCTCKKYSCENQDIVF